MLLVLALVLVVLGEGASVEASTSGMHRVGYLGSFPPTPGGASILAAFVEGLRAHGYIEGKTHARVPILARARRTLARSDA
jgi:hypothetical protein